MTVLRCAGVQAERCRRGETAPNGGSSSRTTEVIYRRELRPVITTGAEVIDQIFRPKPSPEVATGL